LERISTEAGIEIELSDEHDEKTSSSIRRSVEQNSSVLQESDLHRVKQDLQRISTEGGMQIEWSDEHSANAKSSIR
jgi:hypothetical protein